ncbi:hypothetical protein Sango_1572300 [Sesamum angolense]|uniref:Phytocyanin domain-containing protein n=1 Tax=Sesamum angolense TaxID=2727404 RepID=A0AAE1WPQ3_9LAMI|nr:hypothetical protein Sango_1572300 [Sesamum angolense]
MVATRAMGLCLIVVALLINAAAAATSYSNHTVGGDAGWFFNSTTNMTSADYKAWAANQTFNLGDYLMVISVPLTIEGTQYYFSDADDGEQCLHGMAFEIKVNHGLGLPPSLNQPPPPPYVPPPEPADQAQTPPITVVTSPRSGGMRTSANFCWLLLVLVLVSFLA